MSEPTAPFREERIAAVALSWLTDRGIAHFIDPAGNILIGCASAADYRRLLARPTREPARLLIAHMDHPGFHGQRWLSANRLSLRWLGGSPTRGLSGARVWLAADDGEFAEGRLTKPRWRRDGHGLAGAEVVLTATPAHPRPRANNIFGAFHFGKPFWLSGRRLYTRVADDLVGVYAVLQTARHAARRAQPFLGLLTRGEEVGFVGALAHFDRYRIATSRRSVLAVSLETSRVLPGTKIGQGPIVRLATGAVPSIPVTRNSCWPSPRAPCPAVISGTSWMAAPARPRPRWPAAFPPSAFPCRSAIITTSLSKVHPVTADAAHRRRNSCISTTSMDC